MVYWADYVLLPFSAVIIRLVTKLIISISFSCIEKSNVNAKTGSFDEGIVFSMKNAANNFVFGQVNKIKMVAHTI